MPQCICQTQANLCPSVFVKLKEILNAPVYLFRHRQTNATVFSQDTGKFNCPAFIIKYRQINVPVYLLDTGSLMPQYSLNTGKLIPQCICQTQANNVHQCLLNTGKFLMPWCTHQKQVNLNAQGYLLFVLFFCILFTPFYR